MGFTPNVVDDNIILAQWGNEVRDRTAQVFSTAAERDSQWAAPPNGAICVTLDTNTLWRRAAGAWVAQSPVQAIWGQPLAGTYAGQPVRFAAGAGAITISGNFANIPITPPFPNGLLSAHVSGMQWDFPAVGVIASGCGPGNITFSMHSLGSGALINATVALTHTAVGF
jgi:hypothetical protein